MEWELITKMVKIFDEDNTETFNKFMLENIASFDVQAWSVFINLISLVPNEINDNREFYETVVKHIDKFYSDMRFREVLRVQLLKELVHPTEK